MLLTITNTKSPRDGLGYLLHKNSRRVQSFESERGADPRAKAACWTSTSSNLTDSRHLNEIFFDTP